ncbi:TPA: GNAT family N-acetyltransferase [Legionella bozemanae]
MASKEDTVFLILDQIKDAGSISAKKMFGEYAIYCNNKVVALVCDDMFFVKPTVSGKSFLGEVDEQSPYPGAPKYYFISGELWEDSEWMTELIKITQKECHRTCKILNSICFQELSIQKLIAVIHPENTSSQNVLIKCGMSNVGKLKY